MNSQSETPPLDRDVEQQRSAKQFVAVLRRLADGIEQGRPFEIQVAGERLRVPADARLSIEHERQQGQEELEFQLKWNTKEENQDEVPSV